MRRTALLALSLVLSPLALAASPAHAAEPAGETVLYSGELTPSEEELRAALFGAETAAPTRFRGIVMKEKAPAAEAAAPAPASSGATQAPPPPPRSVAFNIRFAFDSDVLPADAEEQLAALAGALKSRDAAGRTILIIGHTDTVGSAAYNEQLSLRRAISTRRALVDRHGVPEALLVPVGRGKDQPLSGVAGDAAENRRVEFQPVS